MNELIEAFKKFPGIGPRQAKRFVSFLMHTNKAYRNNLIKMISLIDNTVSTCTECNKTFVGSTDINICNTCNKTKDYTSLTIVAYDNDVDVLEKSLVFEGAYYVLGSYIPLFSENIDDFVDIVLLKNRINNLQSKGLKEIILALNATSDGDYTVRVIKDYILKNYTDITVSVLGRGLSTGTELEYVDNDTLRDALRSRR